MRRHVPITGLTLLCVVALVGCDTSKPSVAPTSAPVGTPAAATAAPTADASPVPGANVTTEADRAQSAGLDQAGGTITATGSNGAVYTLTLPVGALAQPTTISLSPVSAVATMPSGSTLDAGVQFGPDGLQLYAPARLTIKLPAGTNAGAATGIGWRGDGASLHPVPTTNDGGTLTYTVLHFSGQGAGEEVPLEPISTCETTDEEDALLAAAGPTEGSLADAFKSILDQCYRQMVTPYLNMGIQEAARLGAPGVESDAFDAYSAWLAGIDLARTRLNDPGFTVSPQLAQSKTLATTFLQAWYRMWNKDCVAVKDKEWHVPVRFARLAMANTQQPAVSWGVATKANKLDLQSLLDNLCAKISIDPSRGYTASMPGESGDIKVKAGITIDNGPLVTAAGAVHVKITQTGSTTVVGEGPTDASGSFSATTTWPTGTNSVQFDVLATLIDNESLNDAVIASIDVPTDIQRFDRITKQAEQLSFTFAKGFDTWSHGTIGPEGGSPPWGLAEHLPDSGGLIHMDGRGTTSAAKAWIDRSFNLPPSTTTLAFDVSAELIAGSSSSVRVQIQVGGVFKKTFQAIKITNARNELTFKRETFDISQFAGQRVTIFIEQDFIGGNDRFDKEIYVDNVRIATK